MVYVIWEYPVMSARNDRYTNARKLSRLDVPSITQSLAFNETLLLSCCSSSAIFFFLFCHFLSFVVIIFYRYRAIFGQWLLRVTFHEFVRVSSKSYAYIDVDFSVRYTKTIISCRYVVIMYIVFLSFLFLFNPTIGESK